jgi:hypothetical protein
LSLININLSHEDQSYNFHFYSNINKQLRSLPGKLVLANQAFSLITSLGLEKTGPETRTKHSFDEGYGRQLGYHAFRFNELFNGLNGGAYVLKPQTDTTVLQTGYFGNSKPANGNVIGVDWDYIFLREESKLIVEYNFGKGTVLCVGSYLLYRLPNRNRVHLEAFSKNIFNYLIEDEHNKDNFYWRYDSAFSEEKPLEIAKKVPSTVEYSFPDLKSDLRISPGRSSGNYWDLAGERMLVMGTDTGGITEIWAHPVLSLRDYTVRCQILETGDSILDLGRLSPEIEILPSAYKRTYDLDGQKLEETITVSPREP